MSVGTATETPVLRVSGLSKTFPGTRALRDVSLEIRPNEIHALMGSNGSGKSTFVKTLAGYHHSDPGAQAWLDGEPFDLAAVADKRHDRLRFVHQDLGLVLELGVMDNLALRRGYRRDRFGRIRWDEQEREARAVLDRFGVDLDVRRPLLQATPVERVVVAIAAALEGWEGGRGLLVLDEPTAVLPPNEVSRLFEIVEEVRRSGTSVLYVSHRLDEIFQIADRATVLRGGVLVATEEVADLTPHTLASLMVGEDVDADYRASVPDAVDEEVALEARDLRARYLRGASFTLRKGEILGFAGLLGSGREELPYAVAGALGSAVSGSVRLTAAGGDWVDAKSVRSLGLPLVPAERAKEAVFHEFSVGENLTLPILERFRRNTVISGRSERSLIQGWVDKLKVRTAGIGAPITTLSGGNQQKVIMARCLAVKAPVLLLCEPTAGVDIATRISIYELIAEEARNGLGVIVSSADVGDLLAMCTRVIVMRDGVPGGEITKHRLSEQALIHAMEGTDHQ